MHPAILHHLHTHTAHYHLHEHIDSRTVVETLERHRSRRRQPHPHYSRCARAFGSAAPQRSAPFTRSGQPGQTLEITLPELLRITEGSLVDVVSDSAG